MKRKDPRGRRQGEFRYSDVAAIKILEFLKNKQYSTWLDIARLLNNRGCYGSIKCLLKAGRIQRFALGRYRITDKGREALERLTAKEKRA
jgi:predicted transcriptional regulator